MGQIYRPDNFVFGQSGAGNNWAKGHYTEVFIDIFELLPHFPFFLVLVILMFCCIGQILFTDINNEHDPVTLGRRAGRLCVGRS